jgi:hypothetical protein
MAKCKTCLHWRDAVFGGEINGKREGICKLPTIKNPFVYLGDHVPMYVSPDFGCKAHNWKPDE